MWTDNRSDAPVETGSKSCKSQPEGCPYFTEQKNFDELIARLDHIMAHINTIDDAALNASGNRKLQVPFGPNVTLDITGQDYVLKFFLPNFLFHITTAYNLLRHNGVPLGKKDFVGDL
ncbi:MAG: DUF1993 family protein [Rivularia sp. (in: cyanobacteria)]